MSSREELAGKRLPRGRHGLPRELVAENQRLRLVAAAGEVLAARGVRAITSREISSRAGVSSATFYVYFKDVDACLACAHAMATDTLWELVSAAQAGAGTSTERLAAAVDAAAAFLASEPGFARLLCVDLAVGVPAVAAARQELLERLAGLFDSECPAAGAPAEQPRSGIGVDLIAAAGDLLEERIARADLDALPALTPELTMVLAATCSVPIREG